MKIKFLWMAAVCAVFLASCSDDDNKKKLSKAYTYDGEEYKITSAGFYTGALEDGNYDLEFTSDGEKDFISVQLSGEWDGKKVDLSEEDSEFGWSWSIDYEQFQGEEWVDIIEGFGGAESEFGDVASGQLYIKLIDEEDRIFDVKLSITTTEGKKF